MEVFAVEPAEVNLVQVKVLAYLLIDLGKMPSIESFHPQALQKRDEFAKVFNIT